MHAERLGKYELIGHLASGGMAQVYLARLSGPGGFARHLVLKTLLADRRAEPAFTAMFLDEARLVATLHHQHIAQVFEVGRADDGRYFLAMEYVHGETVRHALEAASDRAMQLPLEFGLTVVCAAAAGLHHAHERRSADGMPLGIVHRDVSPSNLIVSYDGSIKLIDFGIAKAEGRSTKTESGFVKGKTGYMAPEQARGYAVDRRSDVFALGVLAYELTTQTRAFDGASQFETVERTVHGIIQRPSQVIAGYPAALEEVVMTALEPDPDERFQDAEAMRLALERVATELGLTLGATPVMRVLDRLFGARPEPWLATAALEDAPTPVIADSALAEIDPMDLTTRPFEKDEAEIIELLPPPPIVRSASVTRSLGPPPIPTVRAQSPQVIVPHSLLLPELPPRPRALGTAPPVARVAKRARLRHVLAVGVVAVIIGCVTSVVVAYSWSDGVVPEAPRALSLPVVLPAPIRSPPPSHHSLVPVSPPPAPVSYAAATVMLHVTTEPAGATVVLDGVRLGTTPFTAPVRAKAGGAWLKVRMRHRVPVRIRVALEHDVDWNVTLHPLMTR